MLQLDIFEKNEFTLIMQEVQKIRETSENVRRGLYARLAELERMMKEERFKKEETK